MNDATDLFGNTLQQQIAAILARHTMKPLRFKSCDDEAVEAGKDDRWEGE